MNSNFSWAKFDGEFLHAVVYNEKTPKRYQLTYETMDRDELALSVESISKSPTRDFVQTYRQEIETFFLKKQPDLVAKIYGQKSGMSYLSMLYELSQKELGSLLLGQYQMALYDVGSSKFSYDDASKFAAHCGVNLTISVVEEVPLFDFQKEAVEKLYENFVENDKSNGLLVMPTGSGKTRTAVYFLLRHMVSQGYQIIWLTHRHMLIDQTADAFFRFSPLVKLENSKAKTFNMSCVSGLHMSIKATERTDDVMILSIQSVARSQEYLRSILAKKVMIVVDEAHHSVARSYQNTIKSIRSLRKDAKLLGLTATPVRGNESESKYLMNLYDGNIVYEESLSNLIRNGTLSEPVFEHVQTNNNFEHLISLDEATFLKKWGELPDTLAEKIAKSTERNGLIVQQYMDNREKYGRTLMFALNGIHALTLCEDLKKRGVSCDYIYSLNDDNNEKINKFKNGKLDVLINITILTEGSDVPDIQTVFLTRPTQSEVLLMQMIGRGMRGPAAGGTAKVHIVDFCDKWDTFNKWLNPEFLLDQEKGELPASISATGRITTIPADMIRDIYQSIRFSYGPKAVHVAMPYGWYSLLKDGEDYPLLVFEDQCEGYANILEHRTAVCRMAPESINTVISRYFKGFVLTPRKEDVQLFIDNLRQGEDAPQLFVFDNREQIDPGHVADRIKSESLEFFSETSRLFDTYPEVENIYGVIENYRQNVFEIMNLGRKPLGYRVEEMPIETIPFTLDKPYNLDQLFREVLNERFDGHYDGIDSITWTDRPMLSYFGVFYVGGKILINMVLNSSQVPKEVVKYVIYHELLHRDYWNHNKAFRIQEHMYPDYIEHERFLDGTFKKFKFEC